MTYPRFRQIAAESPGLVFELATQLATRLDRTNRKLGDLAFVDVTGRVAHAIMDLCGEPDAMTHPEGMQIKVSRQELSRLVGCSREMAGRVLKVLEEQGLLRATGKTIVVFNARPKVKTRPVIVPTKPMMHDAGADAQLLKILPVAAFGMRHGVGLATQVHDGVRHTAGDVDEREIPELAVGAIESRRELRGELEHEAGAFGRDLAEARIGHFRELAVVARAHPGAAQWLFVEQAHLAEELTLVEVGKHHFVAFLVLDHHFNRAADDVVEDVGQIARVDHHRL